MITDRTVPFPARADLYTRVQLTSAMYGCGRVYATSADGVTWHAVKYRGLSN